MSTSLRNREPVTRARLPRASLAVALLVTSSVGCARADVDEEDAPYSAEIEAAFEIATSDLERSILEDGEIDRHEYERAVEAFVSCLSDRGHPIDLVEQAGYYVYSHAPPDDRFDTAFLECQVGTTEIVAALYIDMVTNPDNLDRDELEVSCFRRVGLVDDEYTVDRWREDRSGDHRRWPFDPDADDRYDACMSNPSSN